MKSSSKKPSKQTVTPTPEASTQQKGPTDQPDTKIVEPVQNKPVTEQATKPVEAKTAKPPTEQAKAASPQALKASDIKASEDKDKIAAKPTTSPATEAKPLPAASPAVSTSPASKAAASHWLTLGAFLLAGIAVTFSILMWQQVNQLDQKLQATTGSDATQAADAVKQQTQALANKVDNLQRTLGGLQTEFDTFNRGDKQADLIADLYSHPKTDMLPLSIRSLLSSAELQVTLSNDVHPLLATLTSIDNHLKASGMEEQNALRQAIKADMDAIRNHPSSDPLKIAGGINTLINQIGQDSNLLTVRTRFIQAPPEVDITVDVDLSDAPTNGQPTADSSTWGNIKDTLSWTADKAVEIGSATWGQLETLVQVTPLNNNDNQIVLSNNEGAILRENIKLRLIGARISILQGQYEQAGNELVDVTQTINTYFNTDNARPVLTRLQQLSAELKNISFPHPTQTIAALETLQSNQ